ncbi:MAG: FliO/MopB family protein, partial [Spirochaetota bacterium]
DPYQYQEPDFGGQEVSYPMMILRTIAVLGVIVIGIWLIFKFLVKKRSRVTADNEIIKVLTTYPLSANKTINIVDIGGEVLVLGVTDSSINLITKVEDKELADNIKLLSSKQTGGGGTFRDQLSKLLGGKVMNKTGQISYLSGYKKRINKMKKM